MRLRGRGGAARGSGVMWALLTLGVVGLMAVPPASAGNGTWAMDDQAGDL